MGGKFDNRIPVLIASSLKPVKDTRAYGKLGLSLGETGKYHLTFMGFSQNPLDNCQDENLYSSLSHPYSRLSRIFSLLKFIRILLNTRPEILIICTYEYLPIASFFKQKIGYKLIYDVQENYTSNLCLNPGLSPSKKKLATKFIHACEATDKVDLYLLAEECYRKEMPEKRPFLILENKFQGILTPSKPIRFNLQKDDFVFLISGTLTPAFGIEDAITWFKYLLPEFPKSRLKIVGHFTLASFQKRIKNACQNRPEIELKPSAFPVPHKEILSAYKGVDFVFLPYQKSPQTWPKMPTKLFESAALGVPVLIPDNPKWIQFLASFSGGEAVDFTAPKTAPSQFRKGLSKTFFIQNPSSHILWNSQEKKLIQAIAGV